MTLTKTVPKPVLARRQYAAPMPVLGPVRCQQCKGVVRWVRSPEGVLRLVNDATGSHHVCLA